MSGKIKSFLCKHGTMVAALALMLATVTANSTCYFLSYQPDEPKGLDKFRK